MLDIYLKPEEMDKIINMATRLTNPMPLIEVMRFGDAVAKASADNAAKVIINAARTHPTEFPNSVNTVCRWFDKDDYQELKKLIKTS